MYRQYISEREREILVLLRAFHHSKQNTEITDVNVDKGQPARKCVVDATAP